MSVLRTAVDSANKPRPWLLRPRFSLRVLLLAVTAFAIAFPIWYRSPYEEEKPEEDAIMRRTNVWQRQWGGGRAKLSERCYFDNRLVCTTQYLNGKRHGSQEQFDANGVVCVKGRFIDDARDGTWVQLAPDGQTRLLTTYSKGILDGPAESLQLDGSVLRLDFQTGQLTSVNGSPPHRHLMDLLQAGAIDLTRVAAELRSNSEAELIQETIRNMVSMMASRHQINIVVDPHITEPLLHATDAFVDEIDLATALTILTQPAGLDCDYRYGSIWITAADGIENWSDPTGVAQIQPAEATALAAAWQEPVSIKVADEPLVEILQSQAQQLGIEIDTTQVEPSLIGIEGYPVTLFCDDHPFKHVLGILLYESYCRCKLDGQRLVILPPETIE